MGNEPPVLTNKVKIIATPKMYLILRKDHFQIGVQAFPQEKGFEADIMVLEKDGMISTEYGLIIYWAHGEIEIIADSEKPNVLKWLETHPTETESFSKRLGSPQEWKTTAIGKEDWYSQLPNFKNYGGPTIKKEEEPTDKKNESTKDDSKKEKKEIKKEEKKELQTPGVLSGSENVIQNKEQVVMDIAKSKPAITAEVLKGDKPANKFSWEN